MKKKGIRKRFGVFLKTILFGLLVSFGAAAFFMNDTIEANAGSSDIVSVGDIYNEDKNLFKAQELKKLYEYLIGKVSFSDIKEAAKLGKTSLDFRNQNSGSNIELTFGGLKWNPTHLTQDKDNNVILTLWLSRDSISMSSKYANRTKSTNDYASKFPDNMYSTSLIRVKSLNAGGFMSVTGDALAPHVDQDANSIFARFTMPTAPNSLTNYIIKPSKVAYQETENAYEVNGGQCYGNTLPNDAYGTPKNAKWEYPYMDYALNDSKRDTLAKYNMWKDDYLWLPSITETGHRNYDGLDNGQSSTGIWQTNENLRRSKTSSIWLRSACKNVATPSYIIQADGNGEGAHVEESLEVRPAFHLNLSKVAEKVGIDPVNGGGQRYMIQTESHGK